MDNYTIVEVWII